jgi:polyisoprenoid-binding protein YceI
MDGADERDDKETIMGGAPSGQLTGTALRALLANRALGGDWVLDAGRSSIQLKTRSMGFRVNGVFREVSGHGTVSADGEVSGTLVVAAASIDTRNARRDEHLRSADIFDAEKYPLITFTADGIRPTGQGVEVTGLLTVCGRTLPLPFEATASVSGDAEVWLDAEVRVSRADFGLSWKLDGLTSTTSIVTIHAVLVRP